MKKTKDELKIYYGCSSVWRHYPNPYDLRKAGLLTKRKAKIIMASISESFIEKHPNTTYYGLELLLESTLGITGLSYKHEKNIKGIMRDVGVDNTKELVGKYVLEYYDVLRAVGISAYKK